jgi:2-dehydro-3-deoxyphosphogalactonate aldolase
MLSAGANGFGLGGSLYRPGDKVEDVTAEARAIVSTYDDVTT